MTLTEQTGGNAAAQDAARDAAAPALAAALDQLWIRFLPEIRTRVDTLEVAAKACAARELSSELRMNAHAAAHKLAGTLGTFSLARGTELAREFELLFAEEDTQDCALGERLVAVAAELRKIVESRG